MSEENIGGEEGIIEERRKKLDLLREKNQAYLNDFYKDMQRWSFNLQVYFLNSRFRQILDFKKNGKKYFPCWRSW